MFCRFWDVFYIDATSRQTISAGLTALAKASNAGGTPEEALAWLVSREERWLLLLNNADDPKLNLQEFFPNCTHGDILITTRNQQMRAHTQEPQSYCAVSGMLPDDALALMLTTSGTGGDEHEIEIANILIEVCHRIKLLSDIVFSTYHRSWDFLHLQLCSPAHTCVQLSADWLNTVVSSRLRESSFLESFGLNRQTNMDSRCLPLGKSADASSPLAPFNYST